jgi:hypothetical protein
MSNQNTQMDQCNMSICFQPYLLRHHFIHCSLFSIQCNFYIYVYLSYQMLQISFLVLYQLHYMSCIYAPVFPSKSSWVLRFLLHWIHWYSLFNLHFLFNLILCWVLLLQLIMCYPLLLL